MVLQHKDLDSWMDQFHKMFLRRPGQDISGNVEPDQHSSVAIVFGHHIATIGNIVNPESGLDLSALPGIDCTGSCSLRQPKHVGCL